MSVKKIWLLLSLSLIACASPTSPPATLYDGLGQYQGIDNIVRELIFIIAKDERVKPRYKNVDIQHFKKGLADYICGVSGGSCTYDKDTLKMIHAGHNYTNTEFNAMVENLIMAMEKCGVPTATQNRLLAVLAPTYKDIVYQ